MRTESTEKSIRLVVLTKEYVTCGRRSRRMKRCFASLQRERAASGHLQRRRSLTDGDDDNIHGYHCQSL